MKRALVVGINNYPDAPLTAPINDAISMKTVLESNGDGSPNFTVISKLNTPVKGELKASIKELFRGDCQAELFYFSGHGYIDELGGIIVTPDYTKNDEGVSMNEILQLANQSNATQRIIILDCCHAGYMGNTKHLKASANIEKGVTILTASKSNEVAIEINGQSVFTTLLIDALQGGAANIQGQITPGSVYAYIDQALGPWKQRPVFKTNITAFTSLRQVTPQVPINILRKVTKHFSNPADVLPLDPTYEYTNEDVAIEKHVAIFQDLQKYESVGLVVPVNEEHMYWAAMNSKGCKLTALGYHYWRLVRDKRI